MRESLCHPLQGRRCCRRFGYQNKGPGHLCICQRCPGDRRHCVVMQYLLLKNHQYLININHNAGRPVNSFAFSEQYPILFCHRLLLDMPRNSEIWKAQHICDQSSEVCIRKCRIPQVLVIDNGPCYLSQEFKTFPKHSTFSLILSLRSKF